tara:strand:+ start:62706 stop:62948 length:243 start_codon:yes stop_codon:yes gene_type:complete
MSRKIPKYCLNQFCIPSATAGLIGPQMVAQTDYAAKNKINMENATHIVWATGGDLVPKEERKLFYNRGTDNLINWDETVF